MKRLNIAEQVQRAIHATPCELSQRQQQLSATIIQYNGKLHAAQLFIFEDGSMLAVDEDGWHIVAVYASRGWSMKKKILVGLGGLTILGCAAAAVASLRN